MLKQHIIDMTGKVVLITGGSRGLGRAMALGFAEAGADIVVASRRIESCEEVARAVEKLGRTAKRSGFSPSSPLPLVVPARGARTEN